MAAEDYFDEYEDRWTDNDPDAYKRSPGDMPCRNCEFARGFKCRRVKGVQKCPHADWFAKHFNKGENCPTRKESPMTNGERYKTPEERAKAFIEYCRNKTLHGCTTPIDCCACHFRWLDLETPPDEEEPLPCPFCGYECYGCEDHGEFWVQCRNGECDYTSASRPTLGSAIAAHNRVAKAVAKVDEMEHAKIDLGPDFAKIVAAEEKGTNK